jgi:hypothetical protein
MTEKPADLLKHAQQERAEASTIRQMANKVDAVVDKAHLLLTAQDLERDAGKLETEAADACLVPTFLEV